jgi:hypothetical protein
LSSSPGRSAAFIVCPNVERSASFIVGQMLIEEVIVRVWENPHGSTATRVGRFSLRFPFRVRVLNRLFFVCYFAPNFNQANVSNALRNNHHPVLPRRK